MLYLTFTLAIVCLIAPLAALGGVVINELNYDPTDRDQDAGAFREFLELYNPGPNTVDLSGYRFVDGIRYTFPNGTQLSPDAYLILARVPTHRDWRNKSYPVLGPYEGKLSNGGERITLQRPDGTIVERFTYDDDFPWPQGSDGYGPSLERIAWDLPADDFHSWRASLNENGTPGRQNSVIGTIPRPVILSHKISPEHPTPSDEVKVQIELDAPHLIASAFLQWETGSDSTPDGLVNATDQWRIWKGVSAPSDSLEWTALDFDDAAWETASGGFGYGDLDQVTTELTDMRTSYSTLYIRRRFQIGDPDSLGSLSLHIHYDDGFIAYINGVEAARAYAPDSYTHRSVSTGLHESTEPETIQLGHAAELLLEGENVISFVGFNRDKSSSTDFVLSPTLYASAQTTGSGNRRPMTVTSQLSEAAMFQATIPAQQNQTLVRFNISLELTTGKTLLLPHVSERRPFESYFVYDNAIPAKLPILWLFSNRNTDLPEQSSRFSGIAVKPLGDEPVQVFDGASITNSRNGQKVKFLKGEEYRGDRTININPESPPEGTTAGAQSPHVEQLSYRIFRDFGVLAGRCDWYRVIEKNKHTQRIAYQQPNENFLEINDRDSDGNIYKIAYNEPGGYSKKTNLDEDDSDYRELFRKVNTSNRTDLEESIRKYFVFEEIMGYEVALFLMSHWDGIKNNIFLYHDPAPGGKWEIIPWDIDKTFGYTDSNPMYWKMPIDFLITGNAPGSGELTGRNLNGPFTRPFHSVPALQQEFVTRVTDALDGLFSLSRVGGMIDDAETLLLDDLKLAEQYTGSTNSRRRSQINTSYDTMRFFLINRHQFLRAQLPTTFSVSRSLPTRDYYTGTTIEGIQVEITVDEGETITGQVTESIPDRFTASNIRATHGEVTLSGNTIRWTFADATDTLGLTYDLTAPNENPPMSAAINGMMTVGELDYPIAGSKLQYMPENTRSLGNDWIIGTGGNWIIADGVLTGFAETGDDPKHVWIEKDFGTGDYTVKADVRMLDWVDGDLARAGIAIRLNPDDGERALNLLYHDDNGSVDLLNDLVAWGTRSAYNWQVGEWYTMTLTAKGSLLTGTIVRTGSNRIPSVFTWDDPRNAARSPGYPGLTGSTLQGLSAQFDNFEVIVNGKVVFSDNFDEVGVKDWAVY